MLPNLSSQDNLALPLVIEFDVSFHLIFVLNIFVLAPFYRLDVWMFGITLWEMYTFGEEPWAKLGGREILNRVVDCLILV